MESRLCDDGGADYWGVLWLADGGQRRCQIYPSCDCADVLCDGGALCVLVSLQNLQKMTNFYLWVECWLADLA